MNDILVRNWLVAAVMLGLVFGGAMAFGANDDDEFVIKNPPVAQEKKSDNGAVKKIRPRKCYRCCGEGTVTVSTREVCDRCEGTGVVISEVELKDTIAHTGVNWWGETYGYNERSSRKAKNRQPCPRCKRQGKVPVKKTEECPTCKGAGRLMNGKPYFDDEEKLK